MFNEQNNINILKNKALSVIILAAGKGTRMISSLPKVLHQIAGKTMLQHVVDVAISLHANNINLVHGHNKDLLSKTLIIQHGVKINWILQSKQKGTGHAVQQALMYLQNEEDILILYGDVPLISLDTLHKLLISLPRHGIALLTNVLNEPDGYGRIIYSNGNISEIVEHKNATNMQRKQLKEVNTGILVAKSNDLKRWLTKLIINTCNDDEIHLTDIVKIAWNEGCSIKAVQPIWFGEATGVNNKLQLVNLERLYQKRLAQKLLSSGVMLADPDRFDLRGEIKYGEDIYIDTNVIFEGKITLGNRVNIGTGCILKNVIIGNDVVINPYTIIENAKLANRSTVGPFANLRSETILDEDVHVGNFVEIKKSYLGKSSKAKHLNYLGDADIGDQVNIGAGVITCNYDGVNKHHTTIGDNVFIGADSQIIAPVKIGSGATIGAGTTVTNNVLPDEMVISRIRQFPIANWTKPKKKK